jgi:hypothetical protein
VGWAAQRALENVDLPKEVGLIGVISIDRLGFIGGYGIEGVGLICE